VLPSYILFVRNAGEAIIAYATPTESNSEDEDELVKELRLLVRSEIGPFAAPDVICITPSLPMVSFDIQLIVSSCRLYSDYSFHYFFNQKTRSGKIMRRVLRKISAGEADQLGDVSTLADPGVVDVLIDLMDKQHA
jgi:acetyl-CoA synthetase